MTDDRVREAFEAWAKRDPEFWTMDLERDEDGDYVNSMMRAQWAAFQAAYALGQQQAEEYRRDAERYRYVRKRASVRVHEPSWFVSGSIPAPNDEHFDAAIDAAIAREIERVKG